MGQTIRRKGLAIVEGGIPSATQPSATTYGSRGDADIESVLLELSSQVQRRVKKGLQMERDNQEVVSQILCKRLTGVKQGYQETWH